VELTGAREVAKRASFFSGRAVDTRDVLVGGCCGLVGCDTAGVAVSLLVLTVQDDRIMRMEVQ
jgi:hypothetical protein